MFTVSLYLMFRILPLLFGSSRNLCLHQTWTRQIIVVQPSIRGLGWGGVWDGVDVLIKQPTEGKETVYLVIDSNWTTLDVLLFLVH